MSGYAEGEHSDYVKLEHGKERPKDDN